MCLLDEMVEIVHVRIAKDFMDEASDVAYAVGRLIGSLVGKDYVHVLGDGRHVRKIEKRFAEYGCIRSKRHLINGKCPNS